MSTAMKIHKGDVVHILAGKQVRLRVCKKCGEEIDK